MKPSTKKKLICAGGTALLLGAAQTIALGRWGIGPLRGLHRRRMMRLPGNAHAYDFSHITVDPKSPLAGKTVCFLGSSVTYGAASLQQSLPEYFAARTGCTVIKEAVSGTTLVDNGPDSYVQRLARNVDPHTKIDLLICQLSTNDATQKKPLGEIAAGTNYDTSTVTGAMEQIISYAKSTWGCDAAFYTGARYDSGEYAAMVKRLWELAKKWDVGVLDLWTNDAFNAISSQQRSLYMSDNIHPAKAGYLEWWCPELEKQLYKWLQNQA